MKIALTHTKLSKGGGAETYLLNLVEGFCSAGDALTLIVGKRDRSLVLPEGCNVVVAGGRWVPQKLQPWFLDWRFRRVLAKQAFDFSISLARHSGHDVVINGGTHLGYLRSLGRAPNAADRLQIGVEKRAYGTARRIVAHSRLVKGELSELYGVADEKAAVLYPPLNRHRFHAGLRNRKAEFRAKYELPQDKRLVLFPSGSHERKGLPLLLEAMDKLPAGTCELVIVGRNAAALPTTVTVNCLGYVDAIEELYVACDVTAMPSLYEPFGLVYVESALCGTPAVFPAQAGAAEVLPPPLGLCLWERSAATLAALLQDAFHNASTVSEEQLPTVASVEEHIRALKDEMKRIHAQR